MDVLKTNAYKNLEDTNVSFRLIDRIALSYGAQPCSVARINALVSWVMRMQENLGNVYMTEKENIRHIRKMTDDIPLTSLMEGNLFFLNDENIRLV